MKIFITVLLFFVVLSYTDNLMAQKVYESDVAETAQDANENYAQIRVRPRLLSNKVSIRLDYGQERNFFGGDTRIREEHTNKVKKFNSAVDALNYMSTHGWEFIFAYTLPVGSGRDNIATQSVALQEVIFLLRKRY